ncbi:hypothetical protein AB0J21_16310 [Streptomyces sp. NPDC049954]|uniref:hypothetical protein n=1 Tax=Streptomyces sp. NPDC049954 TaxID=3155779 RepID=UPI00342B2F86
MRRPAPPAVRATAAVLLPAALLLLTACGSEQAHGSGRVEVERAGGASGAGGADAGASPTASSTVSPTAAAAPDPAVLAARAATAQVPLEKVYVAEVPGFRLAVQSVGPVDEDGFQSSATDAHGAIVRLTVDDSAPLTASTCSAVSLGDGPGAVHCAPESGGLWYLTAGEQHAYVRQQGALRITLAAPGPAVSRALLRDAVRAAHRADPAELDRTLPTATAFPAPVERGDLPPVGDGAPLNEVGASG